VTDSRVGDGESGRGVKCGACVVPLRLELVCATNDHGTIFTFGSLVVAVWRAIPLRRF